MSEALIFASTNPQYDDRLFIELQFQYMKIPSSNLGRTCCVQKLILTFRKFFVHNMFSPCFGKRRASDKDLPVSSRIVSSSDFIDWDVGFLTGLYQSLALYFLNFATRSSVKIVNLNSPNDLKTSLSMSISAIAP